ncbi:tripartite tricarboxylate transporter substrate binding protein [Polaromonas jejuensis]|uniref:Tripartite tricarboxylate transporter substrate binding protein n=1 Tax=Polaromonas jejuensis TaxID=457502 RepID=A0ABW0QA00_9BURK|nr:tripartite tricarboxylate transporter substrate binding protein [Polaromonas jejuensis]
MSSQQKIGRRKLVAALIASSALGITAQAGAQAAYPGRPVKIVVAFAPGGGSDFIARLLAVKLGDRLGQPVIVENRPGAGGNLGAELALKAPADGYTLFLAAASYTVNPSLYKLSFDSVKDITPIAQLARGPFIVAVNPKVPVNSLKELVDMAKKQPGKLTYGSAGNGSIVHMATEYFLDTAGVDIVHAPYKGTSPALTDAIAGHIQLVFGTVASTLPFVKSGQLKALAVTTPKRLAALPEVPTVIEAGFPTYQVINWHGLIAPKGIPKEIQAKLNKAVNEALTAPGMEAGMAQDGLTAAGGKPEEFGALLKSEVDRWGALAKKRGIKAE